MSTQFVLPDPEPPNPLHVTPRNVEGFAQNRPTLVARDLLRLHGVPDNDSAAEGWMVLKEQRETAP